MLFEKERTHLHLFEPILDPFLEVFSRFVVVVMKAKANFSTSIVLSAFLSSLLVITYSAAASSDVSPIDGW